MNLRTLAVCVALLSGCSANVTAPGVEALGDAGAAGSVELPQAGSAGEAPELEAGSAPVAGSGGALEVGGSVAIAGEAGSISVGGSSAGAAPVAGSGGALEAGGAGASGAPSIAGSDAGGSAGAPAAGQGGGGASMGGSAGAPQAGSSAGGASAGSAGTAGAPGVECPYHYNTEGISTQYGHTITVTFPAFVNIQAIDLSPLAGFMVTPYQDGVQSAKAFAAAGVWVIPPVNRMKVLQLLVTPFTAAPLMPAGGMAVWCK